MAIVNQMKALAVRGCLCLHVVLVVWRVTVSWTDQYWLLTASILPFLLEGLYTVIKRGGVEWKLFSLCFFFYLCATLPGIWLLEIKKTQTYQSGNYTQVDDLIISGVEIPVRLSPDTWVLVVEEMMLYLMILGRWVLPRGDVGREQLTQLLFGFIGIASDIMELFSLFDEDSGIRHNTTLTYIILGVWSLSVLQFTLTFATSHRPRRSRGLRLSPSVASDREDNDSDDDHQHRMSILRMELLATVLSLFMQDGPFVGVRLYTMVRYEVITYSLVFFTAKNVLVILLLIYKIFLLLNKICCPKHHKDEDEEFDEEDDDDFHQDSAEIYPKPGNNGNVRDPESGGLRKREDKKDRHSSIGQDFHLMDLGDLQKVIDGPATPAKNMKKSKKHGKHMAHDEMLEGVEGDAGPDKHGQCSAELNDGPIKDIHGNMPCTEAINTGDMPCTEAIDTDRNIPDPPSSMVSETPNNLLPPEKKQEFKIKEDHAHISDKSSHQELPTSDFKPQNEEQPPEQSDPELITYISPGASDLHPDIFTDVICFSNDTKDTVKAADEVQSQCVENAIGQETPSTAAGGDGEEDRGEEQCTDTLRTELADTSTKELNDTSTKELADTSIKDKHADIFSTQPHKLKQRVSILNIKL